MSRTYLKHQEPENSTTLLWYYSGRGIADLWWLRIV